MTRPAIPFTLLLTCVILFLSAGTSEAASRLEPDCRGPEPPVPCCYDPCFRYKNHRLLARKACPCDCGPPAEMILQAVDPRFNCFVDVPICIPVCCIDMPKVDSRRGIFNRGIVEYEWCCGFRVKLVFKQGGNVDVHYYGL